MTHSVTHAKRARYLRIGKVLVALVLLAFILYRLVDIREVHAALRQTHWRYMLYALLFQWIVVYIGTHRLQILLRAHTLVLSMKSVFVYNCIGYFFNLFSLGAMGGDVVKAYYITCETHDNKTEIATVVFLDRLMGMAAVVTIATAALCATLLRTDEFRDTIPYAATVMGIMIGVLIVIFTKEWWAPFLTYRRCLWGVSSLVVALCVIGIILSLAFPTVFTSYYVWSSIGVVISIVVCALFLYLVSRRVPLITRVASWGARTLQRIFNAIHAYRRHKLIAAIAFADSVLLQLIMCVAAVYIGRALSWQIPLYAYFIVFPLATLVLSLPISPSGLGTGEMAFITGFAYFGISRDMSLAFAVLLRVLYLSTSAVGYVCWLFFPGHVSRKELAHALEETNDMPLLHVCNEEQ